ncbi:ImmA/IrrE family metallo-endopeptidase [Alkaliphilus transvaalensis]|uniref:ImmA/IrrE family metallo-endopeptidase n=1 Tax=Alkaliphilus transvaalensis TaxID=114628 RepID=UPI00047D1646|nr:ImmA/IrrE family metallo-endopeptidase [Alkaliphilus transvaalensis]
MIITEKLEEIIINCKIIKSFVPLPDHILGHYSFDGEFYIILINKEIEHNERLYRTVLAEEIGHYRTTIGDITPRRYMSYRDRIEVDKKELLALRWACDFLIPTKSLMEVISRQPSISLEYLADHFMVTEKLLLQKFDFMAKIKPVWEIDTERCLYLHSLPSIFIYNGFID